MEGGLVYALWFVGSARLASPRCASALTLPAPPCRVLLGACPSVQVFVQLSPPQGHSLVSSVFTVLPCCLPSPYIDLPARSELHEDRRFDPLEC